jgi:hypothetical protein
LIVDPQAKPYNDKKKKEKKRNRQLREVGLTNNNGRDQTG